MVRKHNLVSILWSLTVAPPTLPTRGVFHKVNLWGYRESAVTSSWVNGLACGKGACISIAVMVGIEPRSVYEKYLSLLHYKRCKTSTSFDHLLRPYSGSRCSEGYVTKITKAKYKYKILRFKYIFQNIC